MNIGKNIEIMRKRNKLTQSDLAAKLDVSNKTISSWETNRTEPNIGMIESMCHVFNCKKSDIIDGIDPDALAAQAVIDRITTNLKSSTTPAVNVFEENYRKDPVFMDYIEMLYSLSPEDKTEVYNYITFKYLGIGKEKKDLRSSKEA